MDTILTTPLTFDRVWNLRDLGDLPVTTGGRTRSRRVFRGGTLWFATSQDCAALAQFGFDTVIDLRLPQEELSEEDWLCELLDTRYHQLPICVPGDPSPIALVHPGGADHYVHLLDHNAARYVKALEVISEPDNHPVLFHCAAGHDRTGVLAAVVLACLEVDEVAIVGDYVDSATHVPGIVMAYRDHPLYGAASADAAWRTVDASVMEQFLHLMSGTAGLMDWALANGFAESSLTRMRDALVER
jgi:protein-tyrosine phosphatase